MNRLSQPIKAHVRSLATLASASKTTSVPKPADHWSFLSELSKRREQSPTRALMPLMKIPGMINLGTGLPNAQYFPFKSLSFKIDDGTELQLTEQELNECLQYAATPGLPSLIGELKQLITREHNPPYEKWDMCVTTGSQDGLTKAFEMLLNPGDIIIVEAPTYSGALAYLKPSGVRFLPVPVDGEGVTPDALKRAVSGLSAEDRARCRVLYTIPTGQNPSGARASDERKRAVYEVCRELDLLIVEDDPYWQLDYSDLDKNDPALFHTRRSYLSLDEDQRVLRFDSASKILSSGLRLGWVTGPATLVERLCLTTQATALHASGPAQAMAAALLRHWGQDGWRAHVDKARLGYRERREWMVEAVREELGDLVEYTVPAAGMFVWLRVKNCAYTAQELINKKAVDNKVLLLPGESFHTPAEMNADGADSMGGVYVRAAFSVASKEQMREAMKRFRAMITQ